jgi:hypothetical protein
MKREPFWKKPIIDSDLETEHRRMYVPQFWGNGIIAFPLVHIEERKPEFAP